MHSREASLLKFNTDMLQKTGNSIFQPPYPPPAPSSRDANCGMAFTGQKIHPEEHSNVEIQRNATCIASQIRF